MCRQSNMITLQLAVELSRTEGLEKELGTSHREIIRRIVMIRLCGLGWSQN